MYTPNNDENHENNENQRFEEHTESIYGQPNSAQASYDQPSYAEPAYTEPNHDQPNHVESTYTEPSYDQLSYVEPSYTEPTYAEPSHDQPICVEPSYVEPSYSQPAYSENQYYNAANYQEPQIQNAYVSPQGTSPQYSALYRNDNLYAVAPQTKPTLPPIPPQGNKSKAVSKFIKAACFVLICAVMSAASAYLVMEFRYQRGDFAANPQVVLGSTRPEGALTAQVAAVADENMLPQDIYDMALTQVVGIKTLAPNMFSFGDAESESSAPVSGSGFIISSDGYILTNYHVIEMAHMRNLPISVVLEDGSEYPARIVGFEASNDVALLKIDAEGLNPAIIGNSDDIRVGERVYAVGNPLGDLAYTMTDGIVSALDREVTVENITIDAFQFSAAVNRGNSGGPIYNQRGEVIGIVTAKVIRGNVEGIGFAIPINDAIEIATALIEDGFLSGRPLLGVTVQTVDPFDVEHYDKVAGVVILSINPNSAAENATLEVGDIITAIGDEEIRSLDALRQVLREHHAGDTTEITVWREGEILDLTITFDEDLYAGRPDRPVVTPAPTPAAVP